jgi:transcriptional regulator with XRE-family HTH domain
VADRAGGFADDVPLAMADGVRLALAEGPIRQPGQSVVTRSGGSGEPKPVATLLKRLRLARGFSQLQLAERLCGVSDKPTVSRHEVSRWELGQRVPGSFWLGWLAVVLEAPLEELEVAVAAVREQLSGAGARPADQHGLWRPVVPVKLLAGLDHGNVHDLRGLAHGWLAGAPDGWDGGASLLTRAPVRLPPTALLPLLPGRSMSLLFRTGAGETSSVSWRPGWAGCGGRMTCSEGWSWPEGLTAGCVR